MDNYYVLLTWVLTLLAIVFFLGMTLLRNL